MVVKTVITWGEFFNIFPTEPPIRTLSLTVAPKTSKPINTKNIYTMGCLSAYFISDKMRHPIVEYISKDYEYKPQSISLNGNGILLYGINSSGKSTLMKSIGLNVILAQIGYYVAAESFELNPYKSLFTRISGNDNLHRGLSSFMVEMIELTSILKRNNQNTLMIGDEICRGTDLKSSEIIVTYMLQTLSEAKTSFITATHLHDLTNIPTDVDTYCKEVESGLTEEDIKQMAQPQSLSPLQQELMFWHNRLYDLPFHCLIPMARLRIIPKRLAKCIDQIPICVSCRFGQAHKRQWRTKGKSSNPIRKQKDNQPGLPHKLATSPITQQ